ncbi:MAG: hypothetical protein M3Y51_04915 [Actinomycetota bacterium]|nr:hypothetical protein [Actinomycetota bacterium]
MQLAVDRFHDAQMIESDVYSDWCYDRDLDPDDPEVRAAFAAADLEVDDPRISDIEFERGY